MGIISRNIPWEVTEMQYLRSDCRPTESESTFSQELLVSESVIYCQILKSLKQQNLPSRYPPILSPTQPTLLWKKASDLQTMFDAVNLLGAPPCGEKSNIRQ